MGRIILFFLGSALFCPAARIVNSRKVIILLILLNMLMFMMKTTGF